MTLLQEVARETVFALSPILAACIVGVICWAVKAVKRARKETQ